MPNIVTSGFFIDQWIVEQSNEVVEFRIPESVELKINEDELKQRYEDIRSVEVGIWSNGDKRVRIWLKQNELSECGWIMHYR